MPGEPVTYISDFLRRNLRASVGRRAHEEGRLVALRKMGYSLGRLCELSEEDPEWIRQTLVQRGLADPT